MAGRGHDKRGRSRKAPPFLMLAHSVQDHPAWKALSPYAKEALLRICRGYRGPHRFRVMASVRFLKDETRQSHERIAKSVRELVEAGFIVAETAGSMGVSGKGVGTQWRVTFLAAEGIGETHDYRRIWDERDAQNSEARVATRHKGRVATRHKGASEQAPSVSPDGTREGQNAPVPVSPDDTILKNLPDGTALNVRRFAAKPARGPWLGEPRRFAAIHGIRIVRPAPQQLETA